MNRDEKRKGRHNKKRNNERQKEEMEEGEPMKERKAYVS